MSKFMDGFRFDLQLFADDGEHSLANGESWTSGGTTYTAVGSAKLLVANLGNRVTLLEGTVSFSGGPLFWGDHDVNIKPHTSSTATVSAENGVTKVAGTSTVQIIPANATMKIAGKTYTATPESQADLTLHGDGSGISRVVLGSGAVGIASGASVEVKNITYITYTNTSTDGQTVTVSSSAKSAELPPGASVQIGDVTYTNTSDNKTITVPSDRTVTLEKGESVTINGFTYKNTSTEDANNTITVGVDANGNGAVSRIDGKATCAVSVPQGKSIVFGANKFTVVSGPATSTFTADADYAPTLTSDSVVRIDTSCGLKAKGVEVTNISVANPPNLPIPVTVDATDATGATSDYATITTETGGACSVTFTEVGAQVKIDGTLYTNAQPAPLPETGKTTLLKTGGTMKLTAGAVTIGEATLQTGNNNATITNRNDNKITVESGSVITDVEVGAEFDVTISNTSSKIEGTTYKTEENGSAAFTVTKSNGKTTTTLTSGTLIIPDELADGQTVVVNAGAKFRTKPITYENGMTTYKVWVDPTNGTQQMTLEGLNGTVNITSLKSDGVWGTRVLGGDTIYLNGVPYKAGAGGLNIRLEGSNDGTFTPFIKKENNSLLLDPGAFIDYINSEDDSCTDRITITNPNNSGKIVTVKTTNYSSSGIRIVTIEDEGTVQIKPAGTQASPVTYTAVGGQAQLSLEDVAENSSALTWVSGKVKLNNGAPIIISGNTYTAAADGTTLSADADGKIALTSGKVVIPAGATVTVNGIAYSPTGGTMTVDSDGNISAMDSGANCSVTIPAGKTVSINGAAYTADAEGGSVTLNLTGGSDGSISVAVNNLTGRTLLLGSGAFVNLTESGYTVKNSDSDSGKVVKVGASGSVQIEQDGSLEIQSTGAPASSTTYTARGASAKFIINTGVALFTGKVSMVGTEGESLPLIAGSATYTNTVQDKAIVIAYYSNDPSNSPSDVQDVEAGGSCTVEMSDTQGAAGVKGIWYKHEGTDPTVLTVDGDEKVTVTAGVVSVNQTGATVSAKDGYGKNTTVKFSTAGDEKSVSLNANGNIVSLTDGAEAEVTIDGGKTVEIKRQNDNSGYSYTAGADGATLTANGYTPNHPILTSGAVIIPFGGYLTANDCIFDMSSASYPITVYANGKVTLADGAQNGLFYITIPAGQTASVNEKTYTAKDGEVKLQIDPNSGDFNACFASDSKGFVVLGAGAAVGVQQSNNYVTFTNTSADKTVEVDKSGKIRAMSEGAACTVSLDSGTSVTVAGKTYTTTSFAGLSVRAASEVTESGGSVEVTLENTNANGNNDVKISSGAVVIANGVTVTNTATADLKVQAKNGEAIVTTAAGGSCSAVIGAGEDAKIDGTIYTNASTTKTATITMAHGGTAKLTAGALMVSVSDVLIAAKGVTVENKANAALTVDATGDSAVVTVGTGGSAAVTIEAGKSATIDGVTYTNASDSDATITKAAGETTVTLTSGSIVVGPGGSVVTSFGTVTNNDTEDGHTITVNAADGTVTQAAANADYTVALIDGKKMTIGGKEYYGSANAVIHVTKQASDTKDTVTLAGGTVALGKKAKIVTDIGTIMNDQEPLITVSKDGTTIMKATKEEVSAYNIYLIDGAAVTINDRTYTNSSGAEIHVGKAAGSTELHELLYSGYVSVEKNKSVNTNIGLFTNKGTAAIVVDGIGFVQSVKENAEAYEYRLTGTNYVNIDDKIYTNVDSAVIDVTKEANATDLTVTLTAGSVALRTGASIITQSDAIGKITNNNDDYEYVLTVTSEGQITENRIDNGGITEAGNSVYTVEIKAGKTATLGGQKYTTPAGQTAEIRVVMEREAEDDPPTYTNTLTSGSIVVGPGGSVVTSFGTVTNNDETTGHTITVNATDGTVTPAAADADYTVDLNNDAAVTINVKEIFDNGTAITNPMKYHGSAGAKIHVTKKDGASDTVTLTSGTVALGKGAKIVTDIGTVMNDQEPLITVSKDGQTIMKATKEEVSAYNIYLIDGAAVTINDRTYTNSGDAIISVGKAAGSTELREILYTGYVSVATNASVNTNIGLFTNKGTAEIVVDSNGGVQSVPENAEAYEYSLVRTTTVNINGKYYTNVDSAVIDVTKAAGADATDLTVTLTAGSVALRTGASIITQSDDIGKITNNNAADRNILTVTSDGKITENWVDEFDEIVAAGNSVYTVEIKAGKTATLGGQEYTTPAGQTAEIRVVMERGAEDDPPTYTNTLTSGAVILGNGTVVNINGVVYKAAAAQTTLSVDSEQKATLTSGAVELTTGTAIVANGVTVTNISDTALTVAASGTNQTDVTVAAGESVLIDGVTYRNMTSSTATITAKDGEVTLPTDGSFKPVSEVSIVGMATGKTYVLHTAGTKAGTKEWVADSDVVSGSDTVIARYDENTLTINAANQGAVAVLTGDTNGAALKSLTVALGKNNDGNDVSGVTMEFRNSTGALLGTIGNVSSSQGIDFEGGDSIVPMTVSIYAGCTAGNMTATGNATIKLAAAADDCELISGTVELAAGKSAEISYGAYDDTIYKATYTAAADSTATIKKAAAGGPPVLTGGKVTFSSSDAAIVAKGVTVTKKSNGMLTVDATGGSAVVTNGEEGSCTAEIGAGKAVTIDGETFKNTSETAATITKAKDRTAVLPIGSGSVCVAFGKGVSVSANGNEISNEATANENNTITVNDRGEVTAIADNGVAKVVIARNNGTTIVGTTYNSANSATATIKMAHGGTAELISGSVIIPSFGRLTANGITFQPTGGTMTVDSDGNISNLGDSCDILMDEDSTFSFAEKEYTAVGGPTSVQIKSGAIKLTDGSIKMNTDASITLGDKTYTAKADDTILSYDGSSTNLISGSVVIPDGGSLTAGGVTFAPTGGTMTVDSTGAIVDVADGVTYTVALGANQSIKVDGQTYKNLSADGDVTLTVTKADSKVSVACAIAAGKSAAINDKTYTVGTTDVTFTVTNGNGGPFIVPSGSSDVLLGAGAYISFAHLDQAKIRNDGAAGSTVTVAGKVVKAISDGAVCFANLLGANKTVTFGEGGTTYTSPEGIAATVSATALNAVTLTSGQVLVPKNATILDENGNIYTAVSESAEFKYASDALRLVDGTASFSAEGAVLKTGGAEITNTSTAGKAITVTTSGVIESIDEGGSCTIDLGNTDNTVTFGSTNGKTYTAAKNNTTLSVGTGGKITLTAGAVVIPTSGTVWLGGLSYTPQTDCTYTLDADEGLTGMTGNTAAYTVDLTPNQSFTVDGQTYRDPNLSGSSNIKVVAYHPQNAPGSIMVVDCDVTAGKSVEINGKTYTAGTTGNVTLDVETSVTDSGKIACIVPHDFKDVVLGPGAYINYSGNSGKIVNDGSKGTVTVASNVVKAIEGGAKCSVELTGGKLVNFGGEVNEQGIITGGTSYTTASGKTASFSATALDAVTLTSGTVTVGGSGSVRLDAGVSVVIGGKTYTTTTGGVKITAAVEESSTIVTIDLGSAAGSSVTVDGTEYKSAANTQTTITLDDAGKATLTAGSVMLGNGVSITAGTSEIKNTTDKAVVVSAAGVVSSIAEGSAFTLTPSGGSSISYTAISSGIIAKDSGKKSLGIYEGSPSALTVTASGAVQKNGAALAAKPITLTVTADAATIAASKTTRTVYYAVYNTGEAATEATNTAPSVSGNVVGYFKVETGWYSGAPKTQIHFYADGSHTIDAFGGNVTVNAAAIALIKFEKDGTEEIVTSITVSGLSAAKEDDSDVTVTGLRHGTEVVGDHVVTDYDSGAWYRWDSVSKGTIKLDEITDGTQTYYYKVGFTDKGGIITISLTKETSEAAVSGSSYFKITATKSTELATGSIKIDYVRYGDDPKLTNLTTDGTAEHLLQLTVDAGDATNLSSIDFSLGGNVNHVVLDKLVPGVKATVDAAGEKVSFTDKNGLAAVAFTNVGAGSVILDSDTWAEGDSVTTDKLKKGEKIVIGGRTFFQGADNARLTIAGVETISGSFPTVREGTLELNDVETVIAAGTKEKTAVRSVLTVVTYKHNNADEEKYGVIASVSEGEVKGLWGLDEQEAVKVVRTEVEGSTVTETVTLYKAAECTDPGREGWITVTRTNEKTGAAWQLVVSDSTKNLLGIPDSEWTATNLITTQDFKWKGTGYFRADKTTGSVETVQKQTEGNTISGKSDKDAIFLKVVATTEKGVAAIESLGFVRVLENGTFAESVAPQNCGRITIDAKGLAGVDLPKHTLPIEIVNAAADGTFIGLNDADTVSGSGKAGTLTVNEKTFEVAATDKFTVTAVGTIAEGVFTVKDSATAAANPPEGHQLNKTVKYEYDKTIAAGNGVAVTADDWGFERITGLEAGETVTVTSSAKGNGKTITAEDAGNGKTTVRLTETYNGLSISYTQTGPHAAVREKNVNAKNDYTVASLFDFGAAGGEIGIFACTGEHGDEATIAKQTAGVTFGEDGKKYLIAAAKKSGSMATITDLLAVSFDLNDLDEERHEGGFNTTDISEVSDIIIEAPENMGLTLSKAVDAARLYEQLPGGTFPGSLFHVTGAKVGQSYLGFGEYDQISATLKAGEKIIVGAKKNTAKAITAKEDCETVVCGNGRIVSGIFAVGNGLELLGMGSGERPNYAKLTAPSTAVATIEMGEVVGLKGLAAGKKATIKVTDYFGTVVSTVEYAAAKKANADGTLTITRTTTADGVTTVATAAVKQGEDVVKTAAYTATDASINSTFDWVKMNSGYFKTELAAGNMTKFGDVKVEPAATKITKDNAGEIYLKAEAGRQLRLQRVKTDGTMEDVPWADDMTGTLTLVGMMGDFDRDTVIHKDTEADPPIPANVPLPADVKVEIVDAATYYSELYGELDEPSIKNLKAGDTVTTSKLKAGEKIRINNTTYTMGAADLLRVEIVKDEDEDVPVLVNGTVQISNYQTIETTKGSFTIGVGYTVVKVLDGEVVATSGGGLTVTDGNGNIATYTAAGVSYTTTVNGAIRTAALTKGQTVSIGGKTYTAGSDGAVIFEKTDSGVALVDGVLLLEADTTDDTSLALKDATVTFHEAVGNDSHVLVAVRNGEVASITGLKKGDRIKVGDTTYKAETDTVVTKTDSNGTTNLYLSAAGGDVLSAADNTTDVSKPGNAIEGQFSWADVSGRSTGYFAVSGNKATVAEQAAKTAVTAKKGTPAVYVAARAVTTNPKAGDQALHIDAMQATNDGRGTYISGTGTALLDGVNLTVNAPTTALTYTKQGDFHITLNKVAAGSEITGLDAGDKVVTATLAVGDKVTMQGTKYAAGAKGALTFQGEGTNRATLLNGTILMEGGSALLSGSQGNKDDDVTVTTTGTVTVAVRNGVVTSITGLNTKGATVTLTVGDDAAKTVVYEVMYASKDAKTGLRTVMVKRTEGAHVSYGTFTEKQNFYAAPATRNGAYVDPKGYQKAGPDTETNTDKIWTATAKTPIYVEQGTTFQKAETPDIAAAAVDRGKLYDVMEVQTTNGVTTISSVKRFQINAQGVPKAVSGATVESVAINGTNGSDFAKISCKVPSTMALTVTHAALGSVFTGLDANDSVTTETTKGAFTFDANNTAVTVYNGKDTAVYECKTKGVTLTMDAGTLKLTGFKSGTLTVTETTAASGKVKTEYVWKGTTLTKTVTAENGAKEIYKSDAGGKTDDLTGIAFADATIGEVVSDFNWTLARNKTGYFAAATKNGATSATAQTAKTTVRNNTNYIAVTISADGAISNISQAVFDAEAEGGMKAASGQFTGTLNIKGAAAALTFDRAALDKKTIDTAAFVAKTGETPEAGTKVAVANAAAGSEITGLALGDTVATAKLATANAKTGAKAQIITVGAGDQAAGVFTVGAASALSFLVQKVDGADTATVVGGTIALDAAAGSGLGEKYAYVGTKLIAATKGDMTVAVSKNGAAYTIGGLTEGRQFTVEDFEAGTVRTYQRSATALFCTTETKVYDEETGQNIKKTTTSVYSIGTKTSITSAVLDVVLETNEKKKQGWTTYTDENKTFMDDNTLVSGKAVTVDLAALDKRIKADGGYVGGLSGSYQFVIDKYMAAPAKFAGAASVIRVANRLDVQQVIGSVANNYVYKADLNMVVDEYELWNGEKTGQHIAQTIKAADKWEVHGGDLADTIVGAAKGNDTLIGGAGNDTLTGGGASDTFVFDFKNDSGNDTVKSYATGKDGIFVTTNVDALNDKDAYFSMSLDKIELVATPVNKKSKSADVLLHDGSYHVDAEGNAAADNSVLLSGMGNGKAVTINGEDYYFGSAVATKGMTFTFTDGAYYVGKEGTTTANTLTVGTDKTKAAAKTLGDTRVVDLSDTTHYKNIAAVDASKSGNAVILKASNNGATLKGGTYQSTLAGGSGKDSLVGGSGNDVFWFDAVEKDDVVSGYTSGKDSVYLGGRLPIADGMTVEAKGTDVIISNGETGSVTLQKAANAAKAVTFYADETGKQTLSYYVGKEGGYDKNGKPTGKNAFTATLGKDTADSVAGATAGTFTSYYVGNDAAIDTLTLVGADKKTAVGSETTAAVFDMTSANLSSIDILDASGLTAGSTLKLMGGLGDCTLKGSTSTASHETFAIAYSDKTTAGKTTTVQNLTKISDVIELAVGVTAVQGATSKNGTYYTLKNGAETVGTLFVSGVASGSLVYAAGNDKTASTIRRTQ